MFATLDLTPLKSNPNYRKLFWGQTISYFGSMMTYVAVPYQIYELTKNSFLVGAVSFVQLFPLVLAGLYGGAVADKFDRRKLMIWSEWVVFFLTLGFIANSLLPSPSILVLFVISGLSSMVMGFHRPAMDALVPQIVPSEQIIAANSLGSLRYAITAVSGPAIGGILISRYGVTITYVIDAATYLVSLVFLTNMTSVGIKNALEKVELDAIIEGVRYALRTQVILGTYLVDIFAMVFAMPMALYPQLVDEIGKKQHLGWVYAALPMGAGLVPFFSGLLSRIHRQGAGVIGAASLWGVFIFLLAFAPNIYFVILALVFAGVADSISGIFRGAIWADNIPENMRGRLSSLNMLSYMTGPLLGNLRAGGIASLTSTYFSILSGGVICTVVCVSCIWFFPLFWNYQKK